MLILIVMLAIALILIFVLIAYSVKEPDHTTWILIPNLFALLFGLCLMSPLYWLQLAGLDLAFISWMLGGRKTWQFPVLALLFSIGAWGIYLVYLFMPGGRFDQLRAEYPLVSLAERLGKQAPIPAPAPLPDEVETSLEILEKQLVTYRSIHRDRNLALKLLHENSVALFVAMPGFGVGRFEFSPDTPMKAGKPYWHSPVPQPYPQSGPEEAESPRELERANDASKVLRRSLGDLHLDAMVKFADSRGWGYARNRFETVGFEAHRFDEVPTGSDGQWNIQSLELVSLLRHRPPAVYVSPNLPVMSELQEVPTRLLKPFERKGLEVLTAGEDLFIVYQPERTRMLGAVRATKHCTSCHDCNRGDLLGAFSYVLSR